MTFSFSSCIVFSPSKVLSFKALQSPSAASPETRQKTIRRDSAIPCHVMTKKARLFRELPCWQDTKPGGLTVTNEKTPGRWPGLLVIPVVRSFPVIG
jgi:hypothetical protein